LAAVVEHPLIQALAQLKVVLVAAQRQVVLVAAQRQVVAKPPVEYLTQQAVQLDHR
jgi:hypothetical protein